MTRLSFFGRTVGAPQDEDLHRGGGRAGSLCEWAYGIFAFWRTEHRRSERRLSAPKCRQLSMVRTQDLPGGKWRERLQDEIDKCADFGWHQFAARIYDV